MNALKRVSIPATSSHGRSMLSNSNSGPRTHRSSASTEGLRSMASEAVAVRASFKAETKSAPAREQHPGQVYASRRGMANWALQEEKNKRDYNKKVFKSIDQLNTGLKLEDKFLSVGQTSQSAQFSQLANSRPEFMKAQPIQRVGSAVFMNSRETRVASPAVARREGELRTASPFLARKEFFKSSPHASPQISRHTRDSSSFGVSH